MTEVTRWKTIATIAVAFSLGNLFATACGGEGGLFQNASANTKQLEARVADLQDEIENIKCVLFDLEDANRDTEAGGDGVLVEERHIEVAITNCRL